MAENDFAKGSFLILTLLSVLTFSSNAAAEQKEVRARVELNYSALENGKTFPGKPDFDYPLARSSDFKYIRSKGISHIRLPIRWERIQPKLNGDLDREYISHIRDALKKARDNNLTVTLDIHNYGGYRNDKLGGGLITVAHFNNLWSRIAKEFKNDNTITVYDLMNEPSKMPNAEVWPEAAQSAINVIRLVDNDKIIMVEGDGWSSAFHWEKNNPKLHLIKDPAHKIVFSAHLYLDRNNSGTHFKWEEEISAGDQLTWPTSRLDDEIGIKRAAPFVAWLKKHNFIGNIGEIGAGNDHQGWLDALDKTIEYLLENDVSVTYWNAGPYFGNYPYSVQPNETVPEKPQWTVLTKHIAKTSYKTLTKAKSN